MAQVQSYTVQIDINSKGARVIVKDFQAVSAGARTAASAMSILTRAASGLAAVFGARQLIEFSDSLVNLRNRLSLVSESASQTTGIQKELLSIAKETRADFDSTAQVYSRLALSARNLGLSQQSLLQITENLNKAVILSGSNSREAANGLIQLSQAIASNRLGGDELRSVLEQLPLVADIIGKELVAMGLATQGTRGEVRKLGYEGKITADIMANALLKATEDLDKQFANTQVTIAQAFDVLKTSVIEQVGIFNDATGAGRSLADAILLIADNVELLGKAMLFLAGRSLVTLIARFGGLLTVLKGVATFFLGWPGLIAAAVIGIVQLVDVLDLFGGTASQFTVDANNAIAESWRNMSTLSKEGRDEAKKLIDEIENIGRQLSQQDKVGPLSKVFGFGLNDKEIDQLQRKQLAATQKLRELSKPPPPAAPPSSEEQKQLDLIEKIRRELNAEYEALQLTNRERQIRTDLAKIEERLRAKDIEGAQLKTLLDEYRGMLVRNQAQEEYANILGSLREPAMDFEAQSIAIARIISEYPELYGRAAAAQKQFYIESLEGAVDAASGIERARAKLDLQLFDQATAAEKAYTDIQQPLVDYTTRVQALNAVLRENPELQAQVNRELTQARITFLETQRTIGAGVERGFLKIQEDMLDLASVAESALTNAFNNAENALLDFFTTGKLSMTDFVNSLQRDLAKLALRGLVVGTLGSALFGGGGAGGLAGMLTGLFSGGRSAGTAPGAEPAVAQDKYNFASGGSFMVGGQGGTDSQMVAFRASPNERVTIETPEQARRSRGRQGRAVNVNMTVITPDAQGFTRSAGQLAARQQALMSRFAERNN